MQDTDSQLCLPPAGRSPPAGLSRTPNEMTGEGDEFDIDDLLDIMDRLPNACGEEIVSEYLDLFFPEVERDAFLLRAISWAVSSMRDLGYVFDHWEAIF